MIFDRCANPRYKYGNRRFWFRNYHTDTEKRNQARIQAYVANQLQKDIVK